MALFNDAEIDDLISCPKEIFEPPAKTLKLVGGHWRNDAKMKAAADTKGIFFMFMRRNEDLPENFSVGLRYNANDGRSEITLLRCNGKHGEFTGTGDQSHPHWDFHIHKATAIAQDAGFAAEKFAARTNEFASYEQAIQYFVRTVNLSAEAASKFFYDDPQRNLNFTN